MNDDRRRLWADGLPILVRLTGVNERRARAHLGRILRDLKDDAAAALALLKDAEALDPANATAWIAAAVAAHGRPKTAITPLARARAAQLARRTDCAA
jgi:hypothetical protein